MNYSDFNQRYQFNSIDSLDPSNSGENVRQDKSRKNKRKLKRNVYDKEDGVETAMMMTKGDITGVDGINGDSGVANLDPVTIMFFSSENMKRIQKAIRREIERQTNGKYILKVDQDESDILIAMRAILFDQNKGSKFQGNKIKHQVKKLNERTVEYVVPDMISNIEQYYGYIDEISKPIEPPMRPMNVNNAGRRTLSSITTVWGDV